MTMTKKPVTILTCLVAAIGVSIMPSSIEAFQQPPTSLTGGNRPTMKTTTTSTTIQKAVPDLMSSMGDITSSVFGWNHHLVVADTADLSPTTSASVVDGALSTITALNGVDPTVLGLGAVALVIGVAILVAAGKAGGGAGTDTSSSSASAVGKVKSNKKAQKPPEPIDISIPYDAAARLAYERVRSGSGSAGVDLDFDTFNAMYKEVSVAEVALKAKIAKFERAFPGATNTNSAGTRTSGGDVNGASVTDAVNNKTPVEV